MLLLNNLGTDKNVVVQGGPKKSVPKPDSPQNALSRVQI